MGLLACFRRSLNTLCTAVTVLDSLLQPEPGKVNRIQVVILPEND